LRARGAVVDVAIRGPRREVAVPGLYAKKSGPSRIHVPKTREGLSPRTRRPRIRCPQCRWEPRKADRWSCSCFHEWNTFDTGGVCPSCGRLWVKTQCLRCAEWSLHVEWYEEVPGT
jgi:hypothetical protein